MFNKRDFFSVVTYYSNGSNKTTTQHCNAFILAEPSTLTHFSVTVSEKEANEYVYAKWWFDTFCKKLFDFKYEKIGDSYEVTLYTKDFASRKGLLLAWQFLRIGMLPSDFPVVKEAQFLLTTTSPNVFERLETKADVGYTVLILALDKQKYKTTSVKTQIGSIFKEFNMFDTFANVYNLIKTAKLDYTTSYLSRKNENDEWNVASKHFNSKAVDNLTNTITNLIMIKNKSIFYRNYYNLVQSNQIFFDKNYAEEIFQQTTENELHFSFLKAICETSKGSNNIHKEWVLKNLNTFVSVNKNGTAVQIFSIK